jgi:DNA-binding response OmpR family regulator
MEKEHALDAGANEIWSKPFEMDVFTRRLRELLSA